VEFKTATSPHGIGPNSVTRVMGQVLLALVPGIAALVWFFGWGVLINIVIASTAALLAEAAVLSLRKRPVLPTLADLSALLTAVLLAIAVPPTLPWWLTVLGVVFAIVIAKQLYGGLGYNPFNPAMAGYVLLLVSFPLDMTRWLPPASLAQHVPSFMDSLNIILHGNLPTGVGWDALTGATPLDQMRTGLDQNRMIGEIRQNPLWGSIGAVGWEWVAGMYLLGGLFLLWRRIISWHIPAGLLGGMFVIAGLFNMLDPNTHPAPLFHLFSGATMLGAFFIATDPVSAATTDRGKLIYGALIGVLVFLIRSYGGYPDAVAFAVLLMNMAAPTIDYYTQPRVFGQREDADG
jgi:electron transport complex protein RnfD